MSELERQQVNQTRYARAQCIVNEILYVLVRKVGGDGIKDVHPDNHESETYSDCVEAVLRIQRNRGDNWPEA